MQYKFRLIVTQGSNKVGGNYVTETEYIIARSEVDARHKFNDNMSNKINGREIRHVYNEGEVCQ